MTRARLVALAVFAALLVGAATLWRSSQSSTGPVPPAGRARGGQLVASVRSEPRSFNRLASRDLLTEMVATLTLARLVRVNRSTFEVEPGLAERWETSEDGRTFTMHLRPDVTWSDGAPFTSADVVFSVEAVSDPRTKSVLAQELSLGGVPIRAEAIDAATVRVIYPAPSGPGIRLLDKLWMLPKHKLEPALRAGTLGQAWDTRTPPSELVGIGPFLVRDYQPGQRLIFERNPRYWRRDEGGQPLPYLDRIVFEIVADQNTEILRLISGDVDLTQSELRPEDYVVLKREADRGRITLLELGVSPDPDSFWFCLKPEANRGNPRFAFVQKPEFRQAISHAINRQEFVDTVYLGAAIPVWGPTTPGNKVWYWPDVPQYPYDVERAKALLRGIGLEDRNGNGIVEDAKGTEARFTVITQRGISWYERATTYLRDELKKVGIALDIAPLEFNAMIERMLGAQYDAIYYRFNLLDLDPGLTKDLWLSSGSAHVWNMSQKTPATEWERRIDTLILEQAATTDPARRRQLFNDVQRIVAENLPFLQFAAARMYYAQTARVQGAVPSVLRPPVLWNPDTLSVTGPPN